jgi:hypothetical protein
MADLEHRGNTNRDQHRLLLWCPLPFYLLRLSMPLGSWLSIDSLYAI